MARSSCGSCGSPIRWVLMESGRRNPLNPDVDEDRGNILIDDEGRGRAFRDAEHALAAKIGLPGDFEGPFLSHFATCPAAEKHRQRAKAAA